MTPELYPRANAANINEATTVRRFDKRKTRLAPTLSANAEKTKREKAYPIWNPLEIEPAVAADISHSVWSTGRAAA